MTYIKLNLIEGDAAHSVRASCINGLDVEVRAVCLTKDEDDAELGLSFGNIPIFGDPDRRKNGAPRRRREQGPVMDVGCIWVTEVRKRSPAASSGKIKLRDEILALNGQLMVGVDVTGARSAPHFLLHFYTKGKVCKMLPSSGYILNCSAHSLALPCPKFASELHWSVHSNLNTSSTCLRRFSHPGHVKVEEVALI